MKHCERLCFSPDYHDYTNYHELDEVFTEETIEQAGRLVKVSSITKIDRIKEKDGLQVSDFSIDSLLATKTKMPDKVVTMPYPSYSNVEQFNNYVDMLEYYGSQLSNIVKNNDNQSITQNNEIKTE